VFQSFRLRIETETPSGIVLAKGHIMYIQCIHYCKTYETEEATLSELRKKQN
jgi:hypothetical protein